MTDIPLDREARHVRALAREMEIDDDVDVLLIAESETDLLEQVDIALELLTVAEAHETALAEAIATLQVRKGRLELRQERIRGALRRAMEMAGLRKLARPMATLSLSASKPALEIRDEAQIPSVFWVRSFVKKLDRLLLRKSLDQGPVPGAELVDKGPILSVRR